MHIEFLVEDSSGTALLNILVPQILGAYGEPHTWRLHAYKGIGKIPENLSGGDPAKRILLDQLPRLLAGYGKTPGIDAVVVVLDTDRHPCVQFLQELNELARKSAPSLNVMFRLAIEEIEAWYLGDRTAITSAYPKVKVPILHGYVQDSVCGTWEVLADAVVQGGAKKVKAQGWPAAGNLKHDWAKTIGPRMNIDANISPSFGKFRDGLRRLTLQAQINAAERPS